MGSEILGVDHRQLHDGVAVLYSPVIGGKDRFRGVVRGEPFQLGHGAWVVHLRDLEPAYGAFVGLPGRTVVRAALMEALEVVAAESGGEVVP